jgi:hypothetical protein
MPLLCILLFLMLMITQASAQGSTAVESISVTTTCEAMVPAFCQGAFGFQISANGEWQAGPSPEGRTSSGRLAESEWSRLQATGERALQSEALETKECQPRPRLPGVMETVTVAAQTRNITLYGLGGKLDPACGAATSAEAELFGIADQLMRRYYPRPF